MIPMSPRLTVRLLTLVVGLVLLGRATPGAAQDAALTATTLVEAARQATAPFPDPAAAEAAGYVQMFGCVSGPQDGAMGMHYLNSDLVGDGVVDAAHPESLIYAMRDGAMQFVGVEYLVPADPWEAKHEGPPLLMGQLFNFVGAPNRYGNPPFYELHVWIGQDNPNGMFADWNPTVRCEESSELTGSRATTPDPYLESLNPAVYLARDAMPPARGGNPTGAPRD